MNIILIVETFIAFVLAITIHEMAHAAMASLLGDGSARGAGRLSLMPTRQMTAIGTISAIVFSFSLVPAGLGWGRTVDVDARRMRVGPNFGLILVALAGPLVNLALALGIAFLLTILPGYAHLGAVSNACTFSIGDRQGITPAGQVLQSCLSAAQSPYLLRIEQFAFTFAVTNLVLAIVNIIPLHPLDGYRVLFALLPSPQAITFRKSEPYMELILLVVFFLVPYLLAFVGIDFSLGRIIIDAANNILFNIAPNMAFYLHL